MSLYITSNVFNKILSTVSKNWITQDDTVTLSNLYSSLKPQDKTKVNSELIDLYQSGKFMHGFHNQEGRKLFLSKFILKGFPVEKLLQASEVYAMGPGFTTQVINSQSKKGHFSNNISFDELPINVSIMLKLKMKTYHKKFTERYKENEPNLGAMKLIPIYLNKDVRTDWIGFKVHTPVETKYKKDSYLDIYFDLKGELIAHKTPNTSFGNFIEKPLNRRVVRENREKTTPINILIGHYSEN